MKYFTFFLIFFWGIILFCDLKFEERFEAQKKIEKVYYEKRIWPKENQNTKPPFEEVITEEILKNKVVEYIKKSILLEEIWQKPITGEQLQAEMNRMVKNTKDPETLKKLFEALRNDPFLIAECLARPVLADRLIRNWYTFDERFHGQIKKEAENLRKEITIENFEYIAKDKFQRIIIKKENGFREKEEGVIYLKEEEFERALKEYPEENEISKVEETAEGFLIKISYKKDENEISCGIIFFQKNTFDEWFKKESKLTDKNLYIEFYEYKIPEFIEKNKTFMDSSDAWLNFGHFPKERREHTAVWTGTEMIIWGGWYWDGSYHYLNTGGRYNPSTDTWTETNETNAPEGRKDHTAVWTGSEMIVWGGKNSISSLNTGGKYNPSTDTWTPTSTANVPPARYMHTAVWTGSEMIIWGGYGNGYQNTGGRYNPSTDTWTETSTINAPSPRSNHTAVWTGNEMIIWGGFPFTSTGGRYYPSTDIWEPTSTTNAPPSRGRHTAVWTGTEMIIWGGVDSVSPLNTGGKYNPSMDTWVETSTINAPSARFNHTAVWVGPQMIVWGGYNFINHLNTGGMYYPSSNTWTATSTTNAPSGREDHTAIWTGSEMIVWGGFNGNFLYTGGKYNPFSNTWTPTSTTNGPSKRYNHTAIWTGNEMIVWGGYGYGYQNKGGKYNPAIDNWFSTSTLNAPSGRENHTTIWTGSEMIIWGGYPYTNTGGKYNPSTDNWASTSTAYAPSPRSNHTAVWTGSEMIIWGGYNGSYLNTGGRYYPSADIWASTFTANAPSGRAYHTAVWTGNEMIVWGGYDGTNFLNTGGRYYPPADTWASTGMSNVPSPRQYHKAIWTGNGMIVWGGYPYTNAGGIYYPLADAWALMNLSNSPDPREGHTAVWTGDEMIIWGGNYQSYYYNTGGRYSPIANSWIPTSTTGVPSARAWHTAVWTGQSMIVWDGYPTTQSGGIYFPYCSPFQFSNLNPQNGSIDQPLNNLTIDWEDSKYAKSYDLYFGASSPPPLYQSNLSSSIYTLNGLQSNTTYYWYVVAKNSCGERAGEVWSFTTCILPSNFNNLSPANNDINLSAKNLLLDWEDSSSAEAYNLYFGYTNPPPLFKTGIMQSQFTIPALAKYGTYYWYVEAVNSCGNKISEIFSFKTYDPDNIDKGTVYDWGWNYFGQLGDGTNNDSNVPIQVLNLTNIIEIAGGKNHSLALKYDGTVWAWGLNLTGQLGNGTYSNSNIPVQTLNLTNIIAIAGGGYHSLALKDDGTVWAWGYNYHGQLGNGTNNHSNIPVQVLNISNVVAISAGGYHSLALKTDGTVWAWGHNLQGQLGNGTNTDSNIPVQVLNLTDVVSIAGGYLHSLAIRSDGTVWTWGYNGYGQLGDGTNDWSNVPVQTLNLSNVIRVAGGGGLVEYSGHSLALKDNGTVWAWGMNDYGQLGNGTNNHSNVPVQVLNLTGTVGISGGGGHSIALKDNGTVWTWGRNNYGQLGNGTNVSSNIPVQVLNLINPVEIANGMDQSLSIECLIPANFSNLTPENDSINQSTYGLLIDWEDSLNTKSYDLYLGIENPPSLYQSNIQESQYILNGLSYDKTYYWYIVAKNSCSTKTGATWQFTTAPQPKVIPDGSATTIPVMARKNNVIGTELEISWDGQCNPQNANIIYGPLSEISNYTITGSKCNIQNPDIWNIGEKSNIWFVIVSDNGAGIESSWGLNSSGEHRNGTNASSQCGNNLKDNSGTCP